MEQTNVIQLIPLIFSDTFIISKRNNSCKIFSLKFSSNKKKEQKNLCCVINNSQSNQTYKKKHFSTC